MPKIAYVEKSFARPTVAILEQANVIIEEYQDQGFTLTLRQLYYQFVSRDLVANTMKSYKRIGSVINDGRLAGLIDWNAIEDRTRNLQSLPSWSSPKDIIESAAYGYRRDLWDGQRVRIEVWIEKEALAGVFQPVCEEFRVPFFCCRGYTSQSEMWTAARRLCKYERDGHVPIILHFGDHDPSGIDMTRDIIDRMGIFGLDLTLTRLALNMDQVDEYGPPPNPAKMTDSRFAGYVAEYGEESWELDALEPRLLAGLVRKAVTSNIDMGAWEDAVEQETGEKGSLEDCATRWDDVVGFIAK